MNLRFSLFLPIIATAFLSCTHENTELIEKVESNYTTEQPKKISYFKLENGKEIKVREKQLYPNGQDKVIGEIKEGKRVGKWMAYFEDGSLQSSGNFADGKRDGSIRVYYPNGNLRYEGEHEDGKQTGLWKFYDRRGKLVSTKEFTEE